MTTFKQIMMFCFAQYIPSYDHFKKAAALCREKSREELGRKWKKGLLVKMEKVVEPKTEPHPYVS